MALSLNGFVLVHYNREKLFYSVTGHWGNLRSSTTYLTIEEAKEVRKGIYRIWQGYGFDGEIEIWSTPKAMHYAFINESPNILFW